MACLQYYVLFKGSRGSGGLGAPCELGFGCWLGRWRALSAGGGDHPGTGVARTCARPVSRVRDTRPHVGRRSWLDGDRAAAAASDLLYLVLDGMHRRDRRHRSQDTARRRSTLTFEHRGSVVDAKRARPSTSTVHGQTQIETTPGAARMPPPPARATHARAHTLTGQLSYTCSTRDRVQTVPRAPLSRLLSRLARRVRCDLTSRVAKYDDRATLEVRACYDRIGG